MEGGGDRECMNYSVHNNKSIKFIITLAFTYTIQCALL